MSEAMVERVARSLADLLPGESWPTNVDLGGSATGTRDDEYRSAMQEQAREVLDAAMPLVETAESMDALPVGVELLGADGSLWWRFRSGVEWWQTNADVFDHFAKHVIREHGPLRLIWTPEP